MELKLSPCTAKTRFRNLPSRPAVLPLRRPQRRRKRTASSSKGRMFLSRSAHWLIRLRTVSQSLRLACSWRQIRAYAFSSGRKKSFSKGSWERMNAAVSSPAFHAVPCGEETRSAKPRRSSSRHRSSDAGSTFPVSSASSSMKRERPARCNAKTWAICCEVNTDFPFITDKDGACFTQGKNDMSFSVPWQQAFRTPDERNGNEVR